MEHGAKIERMDRRESDVPHSREYIEFLTFCLDRLDKGQSVQTIWRDFLETVSQSEKLV